MRKCQALSGKDMLDMPDCVSLTEKGGCTRLSIVQCIGEKCSFACSDNDTEAKNRWQERLCLLPEEEQIKISRKYYGGAMPWKAD